MFVFGSYEGLRERLGLSSVTFVPDQNARRGLLPCITTGVPACAPGTPVGTPTSVPNLEPRMLLFANSYWPAPNGPNLGGGIATSFTNPNRSIRQDFGTARADYALSTGDSIYGVYSIDDGFRITPAASLTTASVATARNQIASLHETHVFSPQVINTLRRGFHALCSRH